MKLAKWGNSLAIRLPAGLVAALDLKEGDDIEVAVAGARRLDIRRQDAVALLARTCNGYFVIVAFLEVERGDEASGKSNRQAIAPLCQLH